MAESKTASSDAGGVGGLLVAVIGDEDTVTGFLLAGIGHRDARGTNYLVVDSSECITCAMQRSAPGRHGLRKGVLPALSMLASHVWCPHPCPRLDLRRAQDDAEIGRCRPFSAAWACAAPGCPGSLTRRIVCVVPPLPTSPPCSLQRRIYLYSRRSSSPFSHEQTSASSSSTNM